MSEPLSREEREARVSDAGNESIPGYASISYSAHAYAQLRWEATVQAAEERAERLRGALDRLMPWASEAIGSCAWVELAYEAEAKDAVESAHRALAADDAARGDQ